MMPMFGEAFLAKIIEDTMTRLAIKKARDPKAVPAERIDMSSIQVNISHPSKDTFLFYLSVKSEAGEVTTDTYRIRMRQQYPGKDARTVFPAGIITDDSVP